jgi:hypothetical protein
MSLSSCIVAFKAIVLMLSRVEDVSGTIRSNEITEWQRISRIY